MIQNECLCGVILVCLLAGCGDWSGTFDPARRPDGPAPSRGVRSLSVMVTNDDGYGAAGIDAVVEALWSRRDLAVSVVAPADNRSGTGGRKTPGEISAVDVRTGAGRPAKAVDGYPADCLTWAMDQRGLREPPDVVISGINLGENVGPVVDISGTVGAARAAAAHGVPALAVSEVLDGARTDYTAAAVLVLRWLDDHRADIISGNASALGLLENLNVPSCPNGAIRGVVHAPVAAVNDGVDVDCASTEIHPPDDVAALNAGFAVLSPLPPRPPSVDDPSD
jgi:5'-nucleotidase